MNVQHAIRQFHVINILIYREDHIIKLLSYIYQTQPTLQQTIQISGLYRNNSGGLRLDEYCIILF
jgi:hypothetical protein